MSNIDIYVIDSSPDIVMTVGRALAIGDIGISSVRNLAEQVGIACKGGDKVRELRISGHGSQYGQFIGGDWVCDVNIHEFALHWAKLKTYFDPSCGLVTMEGCKVGQAELLLVKMSHYLGVPVRGFRTFQNDFIPGDEGGETRCIYYSCTRTTKGHTLYDENATNGFSF
ncbi:MAG: hypothetical protein H7070_02375 [Saprospiraceae bacterium]|nr:hypothetical protein [Pyrinomonadaceae bacterium]